MAGRGGDGWDDVEDVGVYCFGGEDSRFVFHPIVTPTHVLIHETVIETSDQLTRPRRKTMAHHHTQRSRRPSRCYQIGLDADDECQGTGTGTDRLLL